MIENKNEDIKRKGINLLPLMIKLAISDTNIWLNWENIALKIAKSKNEEDLEIFTNIFDNVLSADN